MTKLLDERVVLQRHSELVESMIEAATGRTECPDCGSTACSASDDDEADEPGDVDSLLPSPDTLEGAVNLATDASEAIERSDNDSDLEIEPEAAYEVACYRRARQILFTMAGIIPAGISNADFDKLDLDTLGPAAVMLEHDLIVAWPLEETKQYPRSAEIGGLLSIPLKHVHPHA